MTFAVKAKELARFGRRLILTGFFVASFLFISLLVLGRVAFHRAMENDNLAFDLEQSKIEDHEMEKLFYAAYGCKSHYFVSVARSLITVESENKEKPSLFETHVEAQSLALYLRLNFKPYEIIAIDRALAISEGRIGVDRLSQEIFERKFEELSFEETSEILTLVRSPYLAERTASELKIRAERLRKQSENL